MTTLDPAPVDTSELLDERGRYVLSRYARTIRPDAAADYSRPGGRFGADVPTEPTVIYHSLFGNARKVSPDVVRLLGAAREGLTLEGLLQQASRESLVDLFESSFLVPAGTDEQDQIQQLLDERQARLDTGELLTSVQLILTNACNFKCEYCFAYNFDGAVTNRNEAGARVQPGPTLVQLRTREQVEAEPASSGGCGSSSPAAMSSDDWNTDTESVRNARGTMDLPLAIATVERALETRRKAGGKDLTVSFFGGEPMLHRSLILGLLEEVGEERDGIRIAYEITTNGSRMDEELVAAFARHQVKVTVSVDYLDKATGQYRGKEAATVPWSTVDTNIRDLLAAGVSVDLTSVLSSDTWDRWGVDLIDYAAELDLRNLNVIVAFQKEFFDEHDPVTVAERLLTAYDYALAQNVQLSGYWFHTYMLLTNRALWQAEADFKTCPAIGRMISVEPNGSVFACKTTNKVMGEVSHFDQIFASDEYADYAMRAYRNGPECEGCELEGTCSGGSAGALEEQNAGNIRIMNRGYCEYMRALIDGLLRRHVTADQLYSVS